LIKRGKQPAK